MRFNWNAVYALLFVYRCVYSVLGQTVILRLTTIPDTHSYQSIGAANLLELLASPRIEAGLLMQRNATVITEVVAGAIHIVTFGNAILINIGFQAIAFIGIVALLRAVDVQARKVLLLLVLFPSFNVWSSIASKEAIVVFVVGLLAKYVVDVAHGRSPWRAGPLLLLPVLYMFKPHFIPAVVFLIGVTIAARYVRERHSVVILLSTASIALLYAGRDFVDFYSRLITHWIFAEPGVSSRAVPMIQNSYDVFYKAPEGMLRAFIGPTWSEASSGLLHAISFFEGVAILVVLTVYMVPRLPRLPVHALFAGSLTLFWIMFANYPLGLANPGTAVRYRTDYSLIVYVAVVVIMSRDLYANWSRQRRVQPAASSHRDGRWPER